MCVISSKNKTYVGTAQCREEDRDMMSEKTGCEIAYRRAQINMLKSLRDELCIELKGLKKYYYIICNSKYYDEKNYMAVMLQRQIVMREEDLAELREMLLDVQENLKQYMNAKAKFYDMIRKRREAKIN